MTIKLNDQILIILTDFNSVKIIKTEQREERKQRVFQSYLLPQFRKFRSFDLQIRQFVEESLESTEISSKFHPA